MISKTPASHRVEELRILVINPNSTTAMTQRIGVEAQRAAPAGTNVMATNPAGSPPAIQGKADGEAALPYLFDTFDAALAEGPVDAVIIACFDDTGLWALRERSNIPVVGIGEAAYHAAMLCAHQFSVVTTLPISIPVLEENLHNYGLATRCAKVRAADVPVLDLEANARAPKQKLRAEIQNAIDEDGCGAIVLGCAGMADLAEELQSDFDVPLIDGVKAAVGLCEMLIAMRRAVS